MTPDPPHGKRATKRDATTALRAWFDAQGWRPAAFQREVWQRYGRGESGLLVTPTGSGKTLAAFGGPLLQALVEPAQPRARRGAPKQPRLRVLWITPLRALASDTARALRVPLEALDIPWTVAMKTGDAGSRDRRLAREGQAEVLVITPESLALQLSYPDAPPQFEHLRAIIVDEWHELLGNKRGVLLQLCLARLRALAPEVRTWGLSATLGNLEEARDVLLPHRPDAAIVSAAKPRSLTIETVLPDKPERFPWAGHLGLSQLQRVSERVHAAQSTLLFTNTRAQAELWHKALSATWQEDPAMLALHHGSLDPTLRAATERGLRDGSVRCVVATSSLDLGVDFPAVDQVIQIGSPKGLARLLQRAGRARHRPGEAGHIICVPTHALEVVEYAAARNALARGRIEARTPPRLSLDVLAQHCITLAVGGGFDADALFDEVRGTHAFADLQPDAWQAVLDFIVQGGAALEHYPEYRRVQREGQRYVVNEKRVATRHRLSIGTITSDGHVSVKFLKGGSLGSVEESFVGRLRPGDRFQFAGKTLELVMLKDMTAYVRVAKRADGRVPRWQGGRMPLSSELGEEVARTLSSPPDSPEAQAIQRLLETQRKLSIVPTRDELLVELHHTRDGWHLFLFPFAGRAVHEGMAALLALRLGRLEPNTYAFAVNDYGLALSATKPITIDAAILNDILQPTALLEDLLASLNMGELARRQFRDIARIAGLLPPALPGRQARSLRQLQASSGLLYDVLQSHDPDHILLQQSQREVIEAQLDVSTLCETLMRCSQQLHRLQTPATLTPLGFPLWAESVRGHLSTEDWRTRVQRAAERLEQRNA